MQNKCLYFLHIPKTSGMKMQYELLDAARNPDSKNLAKVYSQDVNRKVYLPGEFEFVFDPEIANSYNIICGHFARNPIDVIDGLITFSMVREPFAQYLSLAKYAAHQSSVEFNEEYLDLFLSNDNEINTRFEGMTGCDNPQSCFLYSKISSMEQLVGDDFGNLIFSEEKSFFLEKPKSYQDVENRINGIIIGTLEKRNLLIEKINLILKNLFGIQIKSNQEIINGTPEPKFKISKRHAEIIKSKTEIDLELYRRVNESWK